MGGSFATVRTQESNLCNLLGDVFRRACSADVCIFNSGTFRCGTAVRTIWSVDQLVIHMISSRKRARPYRRFTLKPLAVWLDLVI
jgi:hypothetical protein